MKERGISTREILLSLLLEGPMTGYDIKKALDIDISNIADIRINNLYPLLSNLAEDGLLTFTRVEQEKRPSKKIYALTEKGRKTCMEALATCKAKHRLKSEFLFVLKFAPMLNAARISQLVEGRLHDIGKSLEALASGEARRSACAGTAEEFALGLARALLEAEIEFIRDNRARLCDAGLGTTTKRAMPAG
ncbi:MAG: PadR family transcriptional regulator [Parvibaculum sp.]|nr:PadR family transcriptional regulator [Parvibaculum sp.]